MKLGFRLLQACPNPLPRCVGLRGQSLCHPVVLASFVPFFLGGCGSSDAPIAIRLVDRFQPEMVVDTPTKVKTTSSPIAWSFAEPPSHRPPKKATASLGWKSGAGVSGLRIREGRLQGRTTTDFPIIYVRRAERLEDEDLLAEVEVRMRVDKGANLSLQFAGPEDVNFGDVLASATGLSQPWRLSTPIVAGESFQTYTLRPRDSVRLSGIHHILFRPTDAKGAEFAIESLRLLSQRERLARIPSGVGWQGLAEIFRETVVARSPSFPGSIYSLGGVFLALGDDFGTENPASRTLSTTPPKPRHRLFNFFPSPFQRLTSVDPSSPPPGPYSGSGPRKRNLGGMTLVFSPLSATGSSLGGWECCYVLQFRRLNHQAEHSHRRPTRLPSHRQVP